jgi:zinc transport system permease protein
MAYLFGSISTVTTTDLAWIAALAVGVMAVTAVFGREMLAVCIDQEAAHTAGVRVRAMNLLIALTAAVTVVIGMRVVGSLLISAFMIVPVAASSVVARSFWSAMAGGVAIGVIAGAGGLTASYAMGTVPPGPTIVLTALACFAVLTAFGAPTRRILRGRAVSRDRAAADARAARDEASAAPIGG